jgi:hypothetical protein
MDRGISKTRRPPRPYLTVGLQAIYHHLPLLIGSSSSLCRSVSSRSPGGERGQGLCYVSTFYTTLVKKSQQANGASELRRTPPRTPLNRDKRGINRKVDQGVEISSCADEASWVRLATVRTSANAPSTRLSE